MPFPFCERSRYFASLSHVRYQSSQVRGLCLDSTAPRRSVAAARRWRPRATHRGVLTRRPCAPHLAGQATFAARHSWRRSGPHKGADGTFDRQTASLAVGGCPLPYARAQCGQHWLVGEAFTCVTRVPFSTALSATSSCSLAYAHWEACRLGCGCLRVACFPCGRFLHSRMGVGSSTPMRLYALASTLRQLIHGCARASTNSLAS